MDEGRASLNDPLTLDLQRALDVSPSPEFAARVRQRVAAERIRRYAPGNLVLTLAAATAVTALVTAAGLWTTTRRGAAPAPPEPAPMAANALPRALPAGQPPPDLAIAPPHASSALNVPARRAVVQIPARELAAIRAFIADAQRGTFTYEVAAEAVAVPVENSPLVDIVVPPITLLPIDGEVEVFD